MQSGRLNEGRLVNILAVVAAAMVIVTAFQAKAQPSEKKLPERITVTYCEDCTPDAFTNDLGEPAGILIDLWKLWSRKTEISIDFRGASWDETLAIMRDRKADAHAGLFYNKERDRYLEYGARLWETETHYFYHSSLPRIEDVQDLAAYRVGVLSGDYVEGYLKGILPEESVVGFKTYELIMAALRSGSLKIFAADTPSGLYHLQKAGLGESFNYPLNQPLYRNHFFAAAPEGNSDFIQVVNTGMALITREERRAIGRRWTAIGGRKGSKALIIAIDRNYPPFSLLGLDGKPSGLLVDMWNLWSKTTGQPVRFRPSDWAGTLEAIKSGEADIHFGLFKNKEREKLMSFSRPIHEIKTGVFFRAEGAESRPLSLFDEAKVGTIRGSHQERYLKSQFGNLKLQTYKSGSAIIIALLRGEIDAMVNEIPYVEADLSRFGVRGQIVRGPEILLSNLVHAGVAKGDQRLLERINEGLAAIPAERLAAIDERWLTNSGDRFYRRKDKLAGLTADERQWLTEHPAIRQGVGPVRPPFEFINEDGLHSGIASGYMKAVAKRLDIQLKVATGISWPQVIEKTSAGEIDVVPMLMRSDALQPYFEFTRPYLISSAVITTHKDAPFVGDLRDLAGLKVGIPNDFVTEELLQKDHPDLELVTFQSFSDGLLAVERREIDAFVGNLTAITYEIVKSDLTNVKVAASTEINYELSMAVRKDWPELVRILDKTLNLIDSAERASIKSAWMPLDVNIGLKPGTILAWSLPIGGATILVIFLVVVRNRRLGHEIKEHKQTERALEDAYGAIKTQRDRMEEELNIGREIQLSMIPVVFPPFPDHDEFSIFATLDPAREVGGDFYDFFFVDDDRLCICIGDVSGKGVPAALFMAVTKTLIKSRAGDDPSTASIITHVNDELSSDNANSMFVTVFLAILNIKTGELVYTNAGHNPPYLKRNNGALERLSRRHGVVIGAYPGRVYEEESGMLDTGDMLFMYTDGVTEQTNGEDSLFTEKRLEKLLALKTVNSVETAISKTLSSVEEFRSQSDQNDDITVLAVQYMGESPKKFTGDMFINIVNDLSEISRVHAEFDSFAAKQGLSKEVGNRVNLILEELLNNVISHAFQDNREHEINIRLELARTRLTATISDDGIPFNPMGVQTPKINLPINKREVGGLGIHLVRKMAGTIDYQRRIDKNLMTVTVPLNKDN